MKRFLAPLAPALLLGVAACHQKAPLQQIPPPEVTVTQAQEKDVKLWHEYTGRLDAVKSVDIRSRVTGHLEEIRFVDGADVKKDDILFVIDQRTFRNQVDNAEAELARAKAVRDNAKADADRATKAAAMKAMSLEEAERKTAAYAEAEANIQAAEAQLADAKLNLEFTEVRSPIDGAASRHLVSVGNIVTADNTQLTSVTSVNPIQAYFQIDEGRLLGYQKYFSKNTDIDPATAKIPAALSLMNEKDFPYKGVIDFIDTTINPATSTLEARAIFPNPTGKLAPGMFARIRIASGQGGKHIVIPPRAVVTNQTYKLVYVLGKDNIVEARTVELGPIEDGNRVVFSGLKAGETIIVDGLLYARPGAPVDPRPLPPQAPEEEAAAQPTAPKAEDTPAAPPSATPQATAAQPEAAAQP